MKVLVTGGAGFIGGYVVDELIDRGHLPVIFDRRRSLSDHHCEAVYGDVRDECHVFEAMSKVDGWIHLAAMLGTQETIDNPKPAAEINLFGGINMLQAASQYGLPGVYIGVGNHWMQNTYSITKTMIERFVSMYNKERGTKVNIVRAMNAYGPKQSAPQPYGPANVRKITPSFVCRALCGDPIEVYGDGEQISDMVYVGDVAKVIVSALEKSAEGKVTDVVEVGPKEHITVKEFALMINEMCGGRSKIINLPMRRGEKPNSVVCADVNTLSYVDFDVSDLTPIHVGLGKTIDYFKSVLQAKS